MEEYQNFFKLKKFSLRFYHFCIIDTKDYLADSIFIENRVRLKFWKHEFDMKDSDYVLVFCKVLKKDVEKFFYSLEKLKDKMLLLGYTDYPDYCCSLHNQMKEQKEGALDADEGKAEIKLETNTGDVFV